MENSALASNHQLALIGLSVLIGTVSGFLFAWAAVAIPDILAARRVKRAYADEQDRPTNPAWDGCGPARELTPDDLRLLKRQILTQPPDTRDYLIVRHAR